MYIGDAWGEVIIIGFCNSLDYLYYLKAKLVSLNCSHRKELRLTSPSLLNSRQ